jgi:hypothetical protein
VSHWNQESEPVYSLNSVDGAGIIALQLTPLRFHNARTRRLTANGKRASKIVGYLQSSQGQDWTPSAIQYGAGWGRSMGPGLCG